MTETVLSVALRVLSSCMDGKQPDPRDVITIRLKTPYPDSNLPTDELAALIVRQETHDVRCAG